MTAQLSSRHNNFKTVLSFDIKWCHQQTGGDDVQTTNTYKYIVKTINIASIETEMFGNRTLYFCLTALYCGIIPFPQTLSQVRPESGPVGLTLHWWDEIMMFRAHASAGEPKGHILAIDSRR